MTTGHIPAQWLRPFVKQFHIMITTRGEPSTTFRQKTNGSTRHDVNVPHCRESSGIVCFDDSREETTKMHYRA